MITLRKKITIIVSLVTGVLMVGGAAYEAHHLVEQGQILEQQNQAVQIANILPPVADGMWDFDQSRTLSVIRGLFDARSTRRVQVIDPQGKVYVGLTREIVDGTPVNDDQTRLSADQYARPQMPWSEVRLQTLKVQQLDETRWQVLVPLWHHSARDKENFIGHLLVEYSNEDALARSQNQMFRLLVGGFFIAVLIVFLLSIALQYFVLRPVAALMTATHSIADGNFDVAVEIHTHDEMAILARTFNSMRITLKDFTYHLQDLVRQRTAELEDEKRKIQNILIHINEGILTFGSDFRIDPEISDDLTRILNAERSGIVGQDVGRFFQRSNLSANDQDQLRASLQSVLGEDPLAFEANAGHLPQEITLDHKILDLDWVPIADTKGEEVQRMMLTLRDITEKRSLERQMQEARAQHARFLQMVSDIVQAGVARTRKVVEEARADVQSLLHDIERGQHPTADESFPLLHTIKGNLRLLQLKILTEHIHQAEEVVQKQRRGAALDVPLFRKEIKAFLQEANAYQETLQRVWGAEQQSGSQLIFALVDHMLLETRDVLQKAGIGIRRVDVCDGFIQWHAEGLSLVGDLLLHALANSLDHGYLRPKARGQAVGAFDFALRVEAEGESVRIVMRDGGVGIGEDALQELYKLSGRSYDSSDPLRILFDNAISTASDVTTRSGRGVGLFAIDEQVKKHGGSVTARSAPSGGFELDIRLPTAVLGTAPVRIHAA